MARGLGPALGFDAALPQWFWWYSGALVRRRSGFISPCGSHVWPRWIRVAHEGWQRLFQPPVTSASPEDLCHFDLAPLDHINDTKVPDPQPVERLATVPLAVLDAGPGTRAEWVRLEFPQVVQDSITLASLQRPQE